MCIRDRTLAHYSLRSEISAKIGHALAEAYDKKVFRTIALAARESHPITASPGPEPGGSIIKIGANNEYDAQKLVDAFFEAASILDEKNLPKTGRTAVLAPRQYYALVSQVDSNILNRDYGNTQGNLNSGEGWYLLPVSTSSVLTTFLSRLVLSTHKAARTMTTLVHSQTTLVLSIRRMLLV